MVPVKYGSRYCPAFDPDRDQAGLRDVIAIWRGSWQLGMETPPAISFAIGAQSSPICVQHLGLCVTVCEHDEVADRLRLAQLLRKPESE
jgi:hypothetical protein